MTMGNQFYIRIPGQLLESYDQETLRLLVRRANAARILINTFPGVGTVARFTAARQP